MTAPAQSPAIQANAGRSRATPSGRPKRIACCVPTLVLKACDCAFTVHCADDETATLLDMVFGALRIASEAPSAAVAATYRVDRGGSWPGYRIRDGDGGTTTLADADALLFHLDKSLTMALQRRRSDLYFLHAAAVAMGNRVALLPAPSGTGKSTLTVGLLERGFDYLSDELAPIHLAHASRISLRPRRESQGCATGSVAPAPRDDCRRAYGSMYRRGCFPVVQWTDRCQSRRSSSSGVLSRRNGCREG